MKDNVLIFLPNYFHADAIRLILNLQGLSVEIANSTDEVVAAASKKKYRALITDVVQSKKWHFTKFINAVHAVDPNLVFIFFTGVPEPRVVGLENNVIPRTAAYIVSTGTAALDSLRDALFAAGRSRIPQHLREHLVAKHGLQNLSRSQMHVLRCLVAGHSNSEIAAIRGTTVRAVENLNRRTLSSLGINHESSAAARALAVNLYLETVGNPILDLHL